MKGPLNPSDRPLEGLRVLLVEDVLLVAQEIQSMLEHLGCVVVGPVPRLDRAVERARNDSIDGAILDVNLKGEEAYPVADELMLRSIPFVFSTGYDAHTVPPEFRNFPRLQKPFSLQELAAIMQEAFTGSRNAR
jgi:CheY-like chemotaxis protein